MHSEAKNLEGSGSIITKFLKGKISEARTTEYPKPKASKISVSSF